MHSQCFVLTARDMTGDTILSLPRKSVVSCTLGRPEEARLYLCDNQLREIQDCGVAELC